MTISSPGLLRWELAMLVFVHHSSRLALGDTAVFVFFTLSGYWISVMWQNRYRHATHPYVIYLVSRIWRLLPVFVLTSTFALAVAAYNGSPLSLNPLNFTILGYSQLPFQANVPAWSLDVEMQFYLIAPALILATRFPVLLVGLGLLSCMAFAAGFKGWLLPYLVFFLLGIGANRFAVVVPRKIAVLAAIMWLAIIGVLAVSPWRDILMGGAAPSALHRYNLAANIALALLLLPWALHTVRQSTSSFDRMLGDQSYIIYLLHWPILHLIDTATGSYPQRMTMLALCCGLVLVLSHAIWTFYDHPLNKIRERWVRSA